MRRSMLSILLLVTAGAFLNAYAQSSSLATQSESEVAEKPVFDDFVGAPACAECHQEEYQSWSQSTHARAGGPPGPDTVISQFDGTVLRFNDARVNLSIMDNNQYVFYVAQDGHPPATIRVDAVVGGGYMIGGGAQASFSHFTDGSWRFLPFDYSKPSREWFCPTGNRGWVPINQDLSLSECLDWPLQWTEGFLGIGCQNCHGSQITLKYLPEKNRYRTTVKSFSINCESCHGPGGRHVGIAKSGNLDRLPDIGMKPLSLLDKDESLIICFQCHAKKVTLDTEYLPGDDFESFFALSAPVLRSSFYPDGRVKDFAYQKNQLYSDCYLNGSMTCVDCHAPHSQEYRDINGTRLKGRFDNRQCLGCHASKARAPERHTHHGVDSPGNLCTSCHMPFLQHRVVGGRIEFARSDHTIPIPRPLFDTALGIENACQKCHPDKDIFWQQAKIEQWYGEIKPHKPIVTGLLKLRSSTDKKLMRDLLLQIDGSHPLAQLELLGVWIDKLLSPRMPYLEPALVQKLKKLCRHQNIDLRSTALMILDFTRGQDPEIRAFLSERIQELGAQEMAVRHRWAGMLWVLGMKYNAQKDRETAASLFKEAIAIKPDFTDAHGSLGDYYYRYAIDMEKSLYHYEKVLAYGPPNAAKHADAYYKIGRVYEVSGNSKQALTAYGRSIDIAPENAPELRRYCFTYEGVRATRPAKKKCSNLVK